MGMESVFYGFEILKLNRMEAREYLKLATDKTEAGDLIKENNLTEAIIKMLENYALIRVKNCSIPDVVGRSEQLKALEKLKDFAYEVCPLHREDDLEEIVGSL